MKWPINRREFLKALALLITLLNTRRIALAGGKKHRPKAVQPERDTMIHVASGGTPRNITRKIVESYGGIQNIIDKNDIVVLKPNSQWWNQGMTNTDVMAAFIEMILKIPGFSGEIIIADNHQDIKSNSRAWTTRYRNGSFNYNELIAFFNKKGYRNVTKYHWHPAGPNPRPLQFGGYGSSVVSHPSEGDGYVWPADLFYKCPHENKTLLSYPIFTSSYSNVTIDLKNGAFKDGDYTQQPIKFINFSAINHHSSYGGVTASVKNLMGVVDMSCGWPGIEPQATFNTHHVGASALFKFMSKLDRTHRKRIPGFRRLYLHPSVFRFRYTGGVLGCFMTKVRKVDLNIITAIKVGWGSRTRESTAYKANAVLASKDPVALDYYAAEKILLPATRLSGAPKHYLHLNDPNTKNNPFMAFLYECQKEFGGTLDPNKIHTVKTTA